MRPSDDTTPGPDGGALPARSLLDTLRNPVARYKPSIVIAAGVVGLVVAASAMAIGFSPKQPSTVEPKAKDNKAGAPQSGPDFGPLASSYGDARGPLALPLLAATTPFANGVPAAAPASAAANQPTSQPPQVSPELQQRLEMARSARTASPFFPQAETQSGVGAVSSSPPPADAAGSALGGGDGRAAAMPLSASAVQNMQGEKQAFIAGSTIKEDYLTSPYMRPLSPYELKAGAIIPAALVTALNSDLPGEIIAQVTENVFDHASGRHLLVPQGARLFGRYDSQVATGQNRLLIVWNRIIMPDGRSINIGSMIGADKTGASGLQDRVDSHIGPLTRAVALATAITVSGSVAQNASARSSGNLVLNDAAGGVASQASQVGQRFVDRDLNRQPTLKVRAGWPLRVIVNRDIILEPY